MTRPDISIAVSYFARFVSYPGRDHLVAVKGVFRNMRGTLDVALVYGGRQEWIMGFSDPDWANHTEHRSSVGGYVFTLPEGPNSWQSKRQATISRSSIQAESMALSEAEKIW